MTMTSRPFHTADFFGFAFVMLAVVIGAGSTACNRSSGEPQFASEPDPITQAQPASQRHNDAFWQARQKVLAARDPLKEARANFAAKDFRFMAWLLDGIDVPVVQGRDDELKLLNQCGTNVFEETSDAIESAAQMKYQDAVRDFCARYNREMLRLMGK